LGFCLRGGADHRHRNFLEAPLLPALMQHQRERRSQARVEILEGPNESTDP
jgi:hypothetical protein